MSVTLEHCQLEIQELSRRIERLELALARNEQVNPPPRRRNLPEAVASLMAVALEEEPVRKSRPAAKIPAERIPTEKIEVRAALEDYPRVFDRIRLLWSYPECEQLLDRLIIDDRGNRSGFSGGVMDELLFLNGLARAMKLPAGPRRAREEQHDVWQTHRKEERHA